MKHAAVVGGVLVLAACRHPDEPAPASRNSAAPSTAAPAPSAPTVSSDIEILGLRVRSGSLVARGNPPTAPPALWGFSDLAVDSTQLRLEIEQTKHGAPLAQLLPQGALAVVNGGYFEADFRPSTWLKNAGIELAPKSDTSKGGVFALGDAGVYLGPFAGLGFEPQLAIQSFPLIVEQDGKPGIHSDDGRRAARTVVCLVGSNLHFVVIAAPRGDGPTLFEAAALMREPSPRGFGCRVALNLDGGPSTGVWFGSQVPAKQRAPFSPVGYAIAILPR
jgi:uncharacterized protein YigE (DUF2233 family)